MNQAILFNDDAHYSAEQKMLRFSAIVSGSTVTCIIEMGSFTKSQAMDPLSYFDKFKFDYEDLAEQLIEAERFNDQGQIIITTQFF